MCYSISADINKLDLANDALANNYIYNKELQDYLNIRKRSDIINFILDHD